MWILSKTSINAYFSTGTSMGTKIDYLGPFMGKMFIVIVNSYSRWVGIFPVSNLTPQTTIHCLSMNRILQIVKKSGILQIKSTLYHLATNGCTETRPRTFKNTLRKIEGSGSFNQKLNTFLFMYRINPQSTTEVSPAEPLLNKT